MVYDHNLDTPAIYIEPPEPSVLTDGDSADKHDGGLVVGDN